MYQEYEPKQSDWILFDNKGNAIAIRLSQVAAVRESNFRAFALEVHLIGAEAIMLDTRSSEEQRAAFKDLTGGCDPDAR